MITTYTGPNRYENIGTTFNMTLQDVIDYGYDIGLNDYPIWDETKREWLNQRIIEHFMLREIGAETPALFIKWLNRLMNENMIWINTIFEATYDKPFDELRTSYNMVAENESSSDGTSSAHSYASTNPKQTMVNKDVTNYYDTGTYTESDTENSADSTTTTSGYANTDLPRWLAQWATTINNGLTLVFVALEPAFCHVYNDHFNVW